MICIFLGNIIWLLHSFAYWWSSFWLLLIFSFVLLLGYAIDLFRYQMLLMIIQLCSCIVQLATLAVRAVKARGRGNVCLVMGRPCWIRDSARPAAIPESFWQARDSAEVSSLNPFLLRAARVIKIIQTIKIFQWRQLLSFENITEVSFKHCFNIQTLWCILYTHIYIFVR